MNKLFYIVALTCALYAGSCQLGFASPHDSDNDDNHYYAPGTIAEREGKKIFDYTRNHGSDKERWKAFSLSSNDDSENLKLVLVKKVGFTMRLSPKKGRLYFEKPGMKQVFDVNNNTRSYANEKCTSYTFDVIAASATHAVLRKYCYHNDQNEGITPKLATATIIYYLYDIKTGIMIAFWDSDIESEEKDWHVFFARPDPVVTQLKNGYRIDWKFREIHGTPEKMVMHTLYYYQRDKESKKLVLNGCVDLTNTDHDEGDLCDNFGSEPGTIEAITK